MPGVERWRKRRNRYSPPAEQGGGKTPRYLQRISATQFFASLAPHALISPTLSATNPKRHKLLERDFIRVKGGPTKSGKLYPHPPQRNNTAVQSDSSASRFRRRSAPGTALASTPRFDTSASELRDDRKAAVHLAMRGEVGLSVCTEHCLNHDNKP